MYEVKLPKVLFLALLISKHFKKKRYYNTSDLANLANELAKDLVRQRSDKKDYRFLDDTNFGGLRGNFSTLLTFRGLVRKGSSVTGYYGIGQDDRLLNAVTKGEILLDQSSLSAHTNKIALRDLLQAEARMLTIREEQAHIKQYLQRSSDVKLARDNVNFPKEAVVKSPDNVFFLRALVNNYTNPKQTVLEYNLINYWSGTKFKKVNLHLMLVEPSKQHSWHRLFAVDSKSLYEHKPLFLRLDTAERVCFDRHGNVYELIDLDNAIENFSTQNENINNRLNYDWLQLREVFCEEEAPEGVVRDDEFSVFLSKFLKWNKEFSIDGKEVVDLQVSGSGGPDVRLKFSGGTIQNLELEHKWVNYINHGHHLSNAWANCWLFAGEEWDENLILKLYYDLRLNNGDRVPEIFLCVQNGERTAYKAIWNEKRFEKIDFSS